MLQTIRNSFRYITAASALLFSPHFSPTTASAKAEGAKVVILTVSQECEYCAIHQRSFMERAKERGLNVDVKINNFDPATQATQVEQAIAQKPDAIVLWPADASAIVPSLRKIKKAGIPLVITNSLPDKKYSEYWDVYTGPNDTTNGEQAARAMIKGFAAKGVGTQGEVFVIEGVPGTPPQIQRLEGFKRILEAEAPGVKIVGVQPGNWDQTKATAAAAALFTQHPEAKGVYAQADNMLAGVIVAAQRAGVDPAKIVLVGSNCSIEGVHAISGGTQYATVLQSPVDDGHYAADAVADLLDGKKVEALRYLPNPVVTKENLPEYIDKVGAK